MPSHDAIEMLEQDHDEVRDLLSELSETTERATKKRKTLLDTLEQKLQVHTRLEEEIFYPAFLNVAENAEQERLYYEALEEHRVVDDMVLPDLKKTDPATRQFGGRAKVLKELIEHHAEEEEETMFKQARSLMSADDLVDLGHQMEQRRAQLEQRDRAAPAGGPPSGNQASP